jgi:hypothetical protein
MHCTTKANVDRNMSDSSSRSNAVKKLVIATRLHLGRAAAPPSDVKLEEQLGNFRRFSLSLASHLDGQLTILPVIAVDATPKINDYDYVEAIQTKLHQLEHTNNDSSSTPSSCHIHILPVTPWGQFVPALNAIVLYSSEMDINGDLILFVSAEVTASALTIQTLCRHVLDDYDNTLVAGAALQGHTYYSPTLLATASLNISCDASQPQPHIDETTVELNGRTCPWNTLALWNARKLQRTGFVLGSDLGSSAGVEEVAAVALQQKLFSVKTTKAKLVRLAEIEWQGAFEEDPKRKQWHDQKMNSKLERAGQQLQVLSLTEGGAVIHC